MTQLPLSSLVTNMLYLLIVVSRFPNSLSYILSNMWIIENVDSDFNSNEQALNIPHKKGTHTQFYLSLQRSEPPSSLCLDTLRCQTPWVNNVVHG